MPDPINALPPTHADLQANAAAVAKSMGVAALPFTAVTGEDRKSVV